MTASSAATLPSPRHLEGLDLRPRWRHGARTVELVGGSRYLANASVGWAAGSTITYATNWGGTLTVDPGAAAGGA